MNAMNNTTRTTDSFPSFIALFTLRLFLRHPSLGPFNDLLQHKYCIFRVYSFHLSFTASVMYPPILP